MAASKGHCWIVNDDVSGVLFGSARAHGLEIVNSISPHRLNHQGASRNHMLAALERQRPELLLVSMKGPATHSGTRLERFAADSLACLLTIGSQYGAKVLIFSPH